MAAHRHTFTILAEALAIAGLVWMLWIWRAGARDSSSAWRYRDRVEQTPEDEPRDEPPPEDRPIADTRATGWLLPGSSSPSLPPSCC